VPSAPSTPRGWRNTAAGVGSSSGSELEAATVHSTYSGSETHDSATSCDDDATTSSLLAPLAPSAPPSALHRRLCDLRVALRASLGREAAVQAQLRAVTWQAAESAGEVTVVKAALCAVQSADALSKNGRLHDGTLDCLRGALLAHATQQCRQHAAAAAQAAGDALRAGALVQEVQAARSAEAAAAASEIAQLAEELATARATAQVHAQAAKEAAATAAADAQRAITADAAAASATLAAEAATRACEAAMQREAAAASSRDVAHAGAAEANARAEWAEARAAALEASTTGIASAMLPPATSSGHAAGSYDAQLRQLRAQAAAERERLENALAAALRGEQPAGWSAKPLSCDAQVQTEDVEVVDEEKEQLRGSVHDLCEAVETAHTRIAVLEAQLTDTQRASHLAALDAAADAETRANGAWAARLGAAQAAAALQASRLSAALAEAQQAVPRADAGQQTDMDDVEAAQGEDHGQFKILRPAARPPPPLPPTPVCVASPAVQAATSPETPAAAVAPIAAAAAAPKSAVRAQLESVAVATAAAGADLAASRAALAQLWTLLPSASKSTASEDVVPAGSMDGNDASTSTTPAPRARKGLLWSAAQTPESGASAARHGSMQPKAPWGGHDDSPVSVLSPTALFGAGALRGSAAALALARAQEAAVGALGR
jgi:hypothetical protein